MATCNYTRADRIKTLETELTHLRCEQDEEERAYGPKVFVEEECAAVQEGDPGILSLLTELGKVLDEVEGWLKGEPFKQSLTEIGGLGPLNQNIDIINKLSLTLLQQAVCIRAELRSIIGKTVS